MGQRMLFSETITKGLRGWRYAEMIASRDEAIRELQNTPDTLYDPSGILLTSEAAEARFHALITEMHNLARELNEVGVTKNQR